MILYYLYAAFLLLTLVLIGRIAWIQWGWKPEKEVVKYFRPVSEKSVIYPERGAIIGCDGKLLALSTPMYELFMDCTVRKDYFESKGHHIVPSAPMVVRPNGKTRPRNSQRDFRSRWAVTARTTGR